MAHVIRKASILGGLPIIAEVAFGYDSWNMEHWAEVEGIFWRKRDGTKGKAISQALRDRAEKYDPYFSNLIEYINEEMAYEKESEECRSLSSIT